jgi:hypothetical protein
MMKTFTIVVVVLVHLLNAPTYKQVAFQDDDGILNPIVVVSSLTIPPHNTI